MKNKIILLGLCLFFVGSVFAQKQNPMTKTKGQRNEIPVSTDELNPIIIDGRNSQSERPFTPGHLPNMSAKNQHPDLEVNYDNGMPIMLKGDISNKSIGNHSEKSIKEAVSDYLEQAKSVLRLQHPQKEFTVLKTETDNIGQTHIRMQQVFKGVEVYGGQVVFHAENNKINLMTGRYYPTPKLADVQPALTEKLAGNVVLVDIKKETHYKELTENEKKFLKSDGMEGKLVIYHNDQDLESEKLAWHMTVRPNFVERWEYFIDAKSGEIIFKFNHTCSLDGPAVATAVDLHGISRTIDVYEVSNTYYMIDGSRSMFDLAASNLPDDPRGAIWTIDANNTSPQNNISVSHVSSPNNSWNNPTAVSAHFNAGESYNYFKNTHNRNAINGTGGTIVSIINVSDANGSSMENAFWNGAAIFYGNGGTTFQPLAKSLDVAGHEMSHGVVSNSANLQYQGQSGALNESFADIFGSMIDRDDWLIGDDITSTSVFPTGALRSMSDPHNGGSSLSDPGYQPRHMTEIYTGSQDNGGVHINSGIANWAFYKFATAIGKDKAEDVYYRALTTYLTANSQFVDARVAVMQSAADLYGSGSNEETQAGLAFDAVGITAPSTGGGGGSGGGTSTGGTGVLQPDDLVTIKGPDFILSHDTDIFDPNTLYTSSTSGTNFNAISSTNLLRPASVSDDGSYAIYAGTDNKMYGINLDGVSSETVIQASALWENVAISKDGNRIAAITTNQDTAIWVYDFTLAQWAKYPLYNPTFTQGVTSGDVLLADAIEWDYTGEYVIYDALNRINGLGGTPIEYWDVGVIKVWDNATNNYGDGSITKLFSNLPTGISIGNPSYSKNSPYIVGFDYIDENTNEFFLISVNLIQNDIGSVYQNNKLSYPNFSKLDDKMIFDAEDLLGNDVIGVIDLNADKITPSGNPSILIQNAKWGRWYVQGTRDTLSSTTNIIPLEGVRVFPNPTVDDVTVQIENVDNQGSIQVLDVLGREVERYTIERTIGRWEQQVSLKSLPQGTYMIKIQVGDKLTTERVMKQ